MATHANPKRNGYLGNLCAFCNYWEGEANLRSRNSSMLEFDEKARGKCLRNGAVRPSSVSACNYFEISPNASRYAK